MATDPISLVHAKLWDLALLHPYIAARVLSGNRIKLDHPKRFPLEHAIGEADLPELMLLPTTGVQFDVQDSQKARLVRDFEWGLSTGDLRVAEQLFPLEWALFRAMAGARVAMLTTPTWNEKAFVQDVTTGPARSTMGDQEHNRSIPGWYGVYLVRVSMQFDRADLPNYTTISP